MSRRFTSAHSRETDFQERITGSSPAPSPTVREGKKAGRSGISDGPVPQHKLNKLSERTASAVMSVNSHPCGYGLHISRVWPVTAMGQKPMAGFAGCMGVLPPGMVILSVSSAHRRRPSGGDLEWRNREWRNRGEIGIC